MGTATFECPSGKRVLSGGAVLNSSILTLEESHAFDFDTSGHHSGWLIDVRNHDGMFDHNFTEFIICANAS